MAGRDVARRPFEVFYKEITPRNIERKKQDDRRANPNSLSVDAARST